MATTQRLRFCFGWQAKMLHLKQTLQDSKSFVSLGGQNQTILELNFFHVFCSTRQGFTSKLLFVVHELWPALSAEACGKTRPAKPLLGEMDHLLWHKVGDNTFETVGLARGIRCQHLSLKYEGLHALGSFCTTYARSNVQWSELKCIALKWKVSLVLKHSVKKGKHISEPHHVVTFVTFGFLQWKANPWRNAKLGCHAQNASHKNTLHNPDFNTGIFDSNGNSLSAFSGSDADWNQPRRSPNTLEHRTTNSGWHCNSQIYHYMYHAVKVSSVSGSVSGHFVRIICVLLAKNMNPGSWMCTIVLQLCFQKFSHVFATVLHCRTSSQSLFPGQ